MNGAFHLYTMGLDLPERRMISAGATVVGSGNDIGPPQKIRPRKRSKAMGRLIFKITSLFSHSRRAQ
jgi:hypothetical protein